MTLSPEGTSSSLDGLRPEIIRFLDKMAQESAPHPNLMEIPTAEARAIAEMVRKPFTEGAPAMAEVKEHILELATGETKIRAYIPAANGPLPCLFYIHGGGWVLFSLDTHDRLMREYADRAKICVIGIDYSLAPEHKFPRQLEEISEAVKWCIEHTGELGVDRSRIAIGGDSAGANLTVAACLNLKKQGLIDCIHGMVLNYGVFDGTCDTASYKKYGDGEYLLSAEEMYWFWNCYLSRPSEATSGLASPLNADVRGLPPTYMVIADHDVLYEENMSMRDHLIAAGVSVNAALYSGTVHGFLEAVSFGGVADRAIDDTVSWLTELWTDTASSR